MRYREKYFWVTFGVGGCVPVHTGPGGSTTARDSNPAQISSLPTPHSPRTPRSLVIRTHDTHLWEKRFQRRTHLRCPCLRRVSLRPQLPGSIPTQCDLQAFKIRFLDPSKRSYRMQNLLFKAILFKNPLDLCTSKIRIRICNCNN